MIMGSQRRIRKRRKKKQRLKKYLGPTDDDNGRFSVFDTNSSWTAAEEMLLLDAIEQYGFGNWEDAAAHVGTKTADETRDHYYAFFIHGNIGKVTLPTESAVDVTDHTCPNGGPLSPSLATKVTAADVSPEDQRQLGFMPLREDFEREYDNEAETLVSVLMITHEDDDLDIAVKMAQVDMYVRRLRERVRRKRIVGDFGLVQQFFTASKQKSPVKRKESKEEREFHDKMRPFAQFQSAIEREQFFDDLQHEKKLKSRHKELVRYRKHGITKFSELDDFEKSRLLMEKKKETRKAGGMTIGMSLARRSTSTTSTTMSLKKSAAAAEESGEQKSSLFAKGGGGSNNMGPLEITSQHGNDLLSEREQKLCTAMNLKPAHYVTIKTCLIKESLRKKHGGSLRTHSIEGLSRSNKNRLLSFFAESGWISAC
ncbi:PREDICTED: transcriptional adapter 2-beta-like isoform X2 [Priapulus caudatus]|uniref:Transcriptional adapter 2-beta-like isoform X2 n=1 Tax=Priapulus caudatus TaxID=37621 RepID=A0ABM1EAV2_PRICU|nr:PREDICTED: transcriptional adapter 2-beta-like isoform X2 [Priapulus caudatus]